MSFGTILVLLILCVVVFFSVRSIIRKKGGCSCGGSCGSCHCCDTTPSKQTMKSDASANHKKGGLT